MNTQKAMTLKDYVNEFFNSNKEAALFFGVCPTYLSLMKRRGDLVLLSRKNKVLLYSFRRSLKVNKQD